MCMQEKQTDKVIIDVTRSVNGDRQKYDGVRLICVELTIPYLYSINFWCTYSRIKKGEIQGKKCHARTMMHCETDKAF